MRVLLVYLEAFGVLQDDQIGGGRLQVVALQTLVEQVARIADDREEIGPEGNLALARTMRDDLEVFGKLTDKLGHLFACNTKQKQQGLQLYCITSFQVFKKYQTFFLKNKSFFKVNKRCNNSNLGKVKLHIDNFSFSNIFLFFFI